MEERCWRRLGSRAPGDMGSLGVCEDMFTFQAEPVARNGGCLADGASLLPCPPYATSHMGYYESRERQ